MPKDSKKSDGDAFSGVQFGDARKAQDACGMTDCDQVCDVIGQAVPGKIPVIHPEDVDSLQQQATVVANAQWVG